MQRSGVGTISVNAEDGRGLWWFEWEWTPQAYIFECLVPNWWTLWKDSEGSPCWSRCTFVAGGVSLGVGFASACCLGIRMWLTATTPGSTFLTLCLPAWHHALHHDDNGLTLLNCKLAPYLKLPFQRAVLLTMSLHNHRIVTKTRTMCLVPGKDKKLNFLCGQKLDMLSWIWKS